MKRMKLKLYMISLCLLLGTMGYTQNSVPMLNTSGSWKPGLTNTWDDNITHSRKNLQIPYNVPNLPERVKQTGTVQEQNDYYPYGGRHTGGSTYALLPGNNHKFNGKKEQAIAGAGYLDYGVRMYDNAMARWGTPDPLAEKMYSLTPYRFSLNNPVRFIDPNGLFEGDFYDRQGNFLGSDGLNDGKLYLMNKEYGSLKIQKFTSGFTGHLPAVISNFLKKNAIEVRGLIIQNRIEEGLDYTISELSTIGGDKLVNGYILEPAGPSTIQRGQDKRIPEGVYDIDRYSSKKFPDHFILSNEDVPKDRRILYHSGTTGDDTEGCALPGTTKGDGRIYQSRKQMEELRTFIKGRGVENVKSIFNNKISR